MVALKVCCARVCQRKVCTEPGVATGCWALAVRWQKEAGGPSVHFERAALDLVGL